MDPDLKAQFTEVEELLELAGFAVWPQIEHEADDGLASAAAVAAGDPRVERVLICTPDKDLAQCVSTDGRVVQYDRRQRVLYDHAGVVEKFGVPPASIPDYLGLVGDSADGFPGLPGWGAKSASALLARYDHITAIPFDPESVGGAGPGRGQARSRAAGRLRGRAAVPPDRHRRVGRPGVGHRRRDGMARTTAWSRRALRRTRSRAARSPGSPTGTAIGPPVRPAGPVAGAPWRRERRHCLPRRHPPAWLVGPPGLDVLAIKRTGLR